MANCDHNMVMVWIGGWIQSNEISNQLVPLWNKVDLAKLLTAGFQGRRGHQGHGLVLQHLQGQLEAHPYGEEEDKDKTPVEYPSNEEGDQGETENLEAGNEDGRWPHEPSEEGEHKQVEKKTRKGVL